MRSYILKAIILKDIKEISRNIQTLLIIGLTVGMNVFISISIPRIGYIMSMVMSLVLIGFTLTSFIITEEKDKGTLEALHLSPAKNSEIIFGKLFISFLLTVFSTLMLVIVFHHEDVNILHSFISIPIAALVICLFGVTLGLICHTQAMLSGVGTLIMLALFLPELMAPISDYVGYFARSLPTHHVVQIVSLAKDGISPLLIKHYLLLLMSLIATIFWCRTFVRDSAKQETTKWEFSKKNIITSIALVCVMAFSSFMLIPVKGRVEFIGNQSVYANDKYKILVPFDSEKFIFDEFSFQRIEVISFKLKNDTETKKEIGIESEKAIDKEADKEEETVFSIFIDSNSDKLTHKKIVEQFISNKKKEKVKNIKSTKMKPIGDIEVTLITSGIESTTKYNYLFIKGKYQYTLSAKISSSSTISVNEKEVAEKSLYGIKFVE